MLLKSSYLMTHFAQSYFKKVKDSKDQKFVRKVTTDKAFKEIIVSFNEIAATNVVENQKQLLPKIGKIAVFKKMPSSVNVGDQYAGYAIDFKQSRQNKSKAFHLNSHSDGYVMVVHWIATAMLNKKYQIGWFFKAARNLTRKKLAPKIKAGFTDYPITNNKR